jgi:flagellar hook assembly protein FlgD
VKLGIFDVGGRLVRTLVDGPLEAGEHNIGWNGRDSRGALVESGVYFYKLHTGGHELARRMLLVR